MNFSDPNGLSEFVKRLFIKRMLPLVKHNFNLCEIAPRSTGKAHLYKEISPNSILVSGGQTTAANSFYNMRRKSVGLRACVVLDEAAGIRFKDKDGIKKDKEWVYELFPRMKEREWQMAGTLSGGEQQMLAMGRALMSEPKLLMLDEPSMGLAPLLVEQIFEIIQSLHKAGSTILLVEQNAQMALQIADRAYVLESGRITLSGTGAELMASESVKRAYLGG